MPGFLQSEKKARGYPSLPSTLGEYLKKRRLDIGLLQAEAAAAAQTPIRCFELWERDSSPPRPEAWPRIIAFLGYDPRPVPSELGPRLVWLGIRIGLGQRAMAKALGVNVTPLRKWEHGHGRPSEKALAKLRALAHSAGTLPFAF